MNRHKLNEWPSLLTIFRARVLGVDIILSWWICVLDGLFTIELE